MLTIMRGCTPSILHVRHGWSSGVIALGNFQRYNFVSLITTKVLKLESQYLMGMLTIMRRRAPPNLLVSQI